MIRGRNVFSLVLWAVARQVLCVANVHFMPLVWYHCLLACLMSRHMWWRGTMTNCNNEYTHSIGL